MVYLVYSSDLEECTTSTFRVTGFHWAEQCSNSQAENILVMYEDLRSEQTKYITWAIHPNGYYHIDNNSSL